MDGVFGLCIGFSLQPAFTLHSLVRSVSSCRLLKPVYTILKKMDSPLIKDNLAHIVAWNRADLSRSRLYQCKEVYRIYTINGCGPNLVQQTTKKKLLTRVCVSCLRLDGSRVAQNGHQRKPCTPPDLIRQVFSLSVI